MASNQTSAGVSSQSTSGTPIVKGHSFRMASGSVWEVTRTLPGGKLELFCRAESRSATYLHRQVKTWERVS